MKREVDKCFCPWWPRLILQRRSCVNPWLVLGPGHQSPQAQLHPLVRVQPLMRDPKENSLTGSRERMRNPGLNVG